jgi:CcmD family protein
MAFERAQLFAFQETADPDARATEFVPHAGGGNVASGEVLLVAAYAVMWLLAFGLIFMSYRRQKALERRIAGLHDDLARARDRSSMGEEG